jgi:predicted phage tail protein
MTQVNLHGVLAKEFNDNFLFSIKRPKEVFDAISCSFPQFRNRLVELANKGVHYTMLINGSKIQSAHELEVSNKPTTIDLVPLVCGSGGSGGFAIGAIVLGLLTFGVGALAYAGIAFTSLAAFAGTIMSVGLGIAAMGLQMALAPKPDMQRPESDVGGAEKSFAFSSKANVANQGVPVPVGYGRLRVGSSIIQSSIKSYPQAFGKENSLSVGEEGFAGQFITNEGGVGFINSEE